MALQSTVADADEEDAVTNVMPWMRESLSWSWLFIASSDVKSDWMSNPIEMWWPQASEVVGSNKSVVYLFELFNNKISYISALELEYDLVNSNGQRSFYVMCSWRKISEIFIVTGSKLLKSFEMWTHLDEMVAILSYWQRSSFLLWQQDLVLFLKAEYWSEILFTFELYELAARIAFLWTTKSPQ